MSYKPGLKNLRALTDDSGEEEGVFVLMTVLASSIWAASADADTCRIIGGGQRWASTWPGGAAAQRPTHPS